jgi:hypothetical protein
LVTEHLHAAGKLTPGLSVLADTASAFAAAQAAWRFYNNERITLPSLVEPLHAAAQQARAPVAVDWGLVVHDWSGLPYPNHATKNDLVSLGKKNVLGYDLAMALLVDGRAGDPISPLEVRLRSRTGQWSTRTPAPRKNATHLNELLPTMDDIARLRLGERLVHIVDREADSVGHYRAWSAAGHRWLVRADNERVVTWEGQEFSLREIATILARRQAFQRSREVVYRGESATQEIAETTVVLERPAWRDWHRGGRRHKARVPGDPLTLRLVISRVRNGHGKRVAEWLLLTNVPAKVPTELIALWYYWRWRIESFFKLLKSAGMQVEQWQQDDGLAIARRLLIASMACVIVWRLERSPAPEAIEMRTLLVRLSGRLMKRGKSHTAPALLAGLWVLLAALSVLEDHSVAELKRIKHLILAWDTT